MNNLEEKNISSCVKLGCSACCRDIDIRLTEKEAVFLQNAGTSLEKLSLIANMGGAWGMGGSVDGRVYYHISGACGNLSAGGMCDSYEDPDRPSACGQLKPGQGFLGFFNGCNDIREARGLRSIKQDGTFK